MKAKWFVRLKSSAVLIAVLTGILIIDMFYRVVSKKISIGLFISMFNTLHSLIGKMSWQITELTDEIAKDNEFIKDYNHFSALPEQSIEKELYLLTKIVLKRLHLKMLVFDIQTPKNTS